MEEVTMKCTILLVFAILLSTVSAATWASPKDDQAAQDRVIPMLVTVNAQGQVTEVSPPYEFRPAFVHLLRDTLDKMITKPAMKDGKAVKSQFLIQLSLTLTPAENGKSSAGFKYVSSKSLPSGTWHWVRDEQHRLALANEQGAVDPDHFAIAHTGLGVLQREMQSAQLQQMYREQANH